MRIVHSLSLNVDTAEEQLPDYTADFPCLTTRAELQYYPDALVPWHWHPAAELFYMLEGLLDYHIPGATIAIILALLVACCPVLGESSQSATLFFSSFAGGGFEYTVEIDDPSIVSCETKYEYEEQDEPIDGASFDFMATFKGLKPGSTRVTVYGKSPIMKNEDNVYTVTVDDALNATLTPVRTIDTFYVFRMIEGGVATYMITMDDGGYHVSVDEGPEQLISTDVIDELMNVIGTYDVTAWDGFKESDYNVEDGENFRLEIRFTDGTGIVASGDNAFPDNYSDAMEAMWRILTWNAGDDIIF